MIEMQSHIEIKRKELLAKSRPALGFHVSGIAHCVMDINCIGMHIWRPALIMLWPKKKQYSAHHCHTLQALSDACFEGCHCWIAIVSFFPACSVLLVWTRKQVRHDLAGCRGMERWDSFLGWNKHLKMNTIDVIFVHCTGHHHHSNIDTFHGVSVYRCLGLSH